MQTCLLSEAFAHASSFINCRSRVKTVLLILYGILVHTQLYTIIPEISNVTKVMAYYRLWSP